MGFATAPRYLLGRIFTGSHDILSVENFLDSDFLRVLRPQPESMSEQIQLFAEISSDGWMIAEFALPHSDTVKPA
jgi:hypothetical protein